MNIKLFGPDSNELGGIEKYVYTGYDMPTHVGGEKVASFISALKQDIQDKSKGKYLLGPALEGGPFYDGKWAALPLGYDLGHGHIPHNKDGFLGIFIMPELASIVGKGKNMTFKKVIDIALKSPEFKNEELEWVLKHYDYAVGRINQAYRNHLKLNPVEVARFGDHYERNEHGVFVLK